MRQVVFLHIPKTAGTSLRLWLQQALPEATAGDDGVDYATALADQIKPRSLITGHYDIHLLDRVEPYVPETRVITVLRDPVEILHSTFAYYRGLPEADVADVERRDPWLAAWVRALQASKSFEAFRELGPLPDWLTGLQARYLVRGAGGGGASAIARRLEPNDVAQACQRLESLAAFGLAEDMGRSAALFCHALGWPWLGVPGAHNKGPKDRPKKGDGFGIDLSADQTLYDFARDLFERRWSALCAEFGADPSTKDKGLAQVAIGLTERARLRQITPIRDVDWFGVEDGLFVTGADERFLFEEEHRWVRIMNGPMTVTLPTAITAPRVSICFGYLEPSPMESPPEVYGNGRKLPVWPRYEDLGGGLWRIWLDVDVWPLGFDRVGGLHLTISHPQWTKPRKDGWGSLLGVISPCWRPTEDEVDASQSMQAVASGVGPALRSVGGGSGRPEQPSAA
jgi:hypothetical protein